MSAPTIHVWFQVLDTNGKRFRGFQLDRTTIACTANVNDLRRAVKINGKPVLDPIRPEQLKVYTDMASFDSGDYPLGDNELIG